MFKALISRALCTAGRSRRSPTIPRHRLGLGQSVFPCLELMPSCRIVATDLSPNLLRILLDHVNGRNRCAGQVVPVCMDATRDYYRAGSFDLRHWGRHPASPADPLAAIQAARERLSPAGTPSF